MFCNNNFYIMNYEDLKMYKVLACDSGYILLENSDSMLDRFIIVSNIKEKKKMRYIWNKEYSFDYLNNQKAFTIYCKLIDVFSSNSIEILNHQEKLKKIRNYFIIELSSFFVSKGYNKQITYDINVISDAKINGDSYAITPIDNKINIYMTISNKANEEIIYQDHTTIIDNLDFNINSLLNIIDKKVKNAIIKN